MPYLIAFVAGFLSTLVCHQGVLAAFYAAGLVPRAPYPMDPVPPFGVPAVVSLAFWGGLWAVAIWPFLRRAAGAGYWLRALIIGAIGPSAVALFIVFPLKGMAFAGGWDPKLITGALILNGAWGLGVGAIMWLYRRRSA